LAAIYGSVNLPPWEMKVKNHCTRLNLVQSIVDYLVRPVFSQQHVIDSDIFASTEAGRNKAMHCGI